jgi:hypothetical protein
MHSSSFIRYFVAISIFGFLATQALPVDPADGLPSGKRVHKPFRRAKGDPCSGGEVNKRVESPRDPQTGLPTGRISRLLRRVLEGRSALSDDPDDGGERRRAERRSSPGRRGDTLTFGSSTVTLPGIGLPTTLPPATTVSKTVSSVLAQSSESICHLTTTNPQYAAPLSF